MARRVDALLGLLLVASLGCGFRTGEADTPTALADSANRQGVAALGQGELSLAEDAFALAWERSRSVDDTAGMATSLLNLSRVDDARWQWQRGLGRAEHALTLTQSAPALRGATLTRLAELRSRTGEHPAAIDAARAALRLAPGDTRPRRAAQQLVGDRHTTLAYALTRAGGPHCAEAATALQAATDAYGRRPTAGQRAALAFLRGLLALANADASAAETWLQRALTLDRDLGQPLLVAADLDALASVSELQADKEQAVARLQRAFAVREAVDAPRQALATGEQLTARGDGRPELVGRLASLRARLGDVALQPPSPPGHCD